MRFWHPQAAAARRFGYRDAGAYGAQRFELEGDVGLAEGTDAGAKAKPVAPVVLPQGGRARDAERPTPMR
jgi:hypothetical protein